MGQESGSQSSKGTQFEILEAGIELGPPRCLGPAQVCINDPMHRENPYDTADLSIKSM